MKIFGNLGPAPATLPTPLNTLISKPIDVTAVSLKRYLEAHSITEASIGGSLATPIPTVRYFVIHDTSAPYLKNDPFPANINEPSWGPNKLSRWEGLKVTHVYVNRLGESVTAANFTDRSFPGTKYGRVRERRPLFVHIELIQPRRRDPSGGANNDALSPNPGFTAKQLDRLALLYVAASVRSGRWLMPAYHAAIDAGIPDAHDDPQNFDLNAWLTSLQSLLPEVRP